jgi:hypothetical protein
MDVRVRSVHTGAPCTLPHVTKNQSLAKEKRLAAQRGATRARNTATFSTLLSVANTRKDPPWGGPSLSAPQLNSRTQSKTARAGEDPPGGGVARLPATPRQRDLVVHQGPRAECPTCGKTEENPPLMGPIDSLPPLPVVWERPPTQHIETPWSPVIPCTTPGGPSRKGDLIPIA